MPVKDPKKQALMSAIMPEQDDTIVSETMDDRRKRLSKKKMSGGMLDVIYNRTKDVNGRLSEIDSE